MFALTIYGFHLYRVFWLKAKEEQLKEIPLNGGQWEMYEQSKQWTSLCKNDAKYVVVTGKVIFVYCDVALFLNHLRE